MSRFIYFLGGALRETGQALDRMGMTFAGNPAFKEQCTLQGCPKSPFRGTIYSAGHLLTFPEDRFKFVLPFGVAGCPLNARSRVLQMLSSTTAAVTCPGPFSAYLRDVIRHQIECFFPIFF